MRHGRHPHPWDRRGDYPGGDGYSDVVDVTDHSSGTNAFFEAAKDVARPCAHRLANSQPQKQQTCSSTTDGPCPRDILVPAVSRCAQERARPTASGGLALRPSSALPAHAPTVAFAGASRRLCARQPRLPQVVRRRRAADPHLAARIWATASAGSVTNIGQVCAAGRSLPSRWSHGAATALNPVRRAGTNMAR
jgi:hypothetical protein